MKKMKSIERFLPGQREKDEAKMIPSAWTPLHCLTAAPFFPTTSSQAGEVAQWVKALSPDPKDMSESPRTLTVAERTDSYRLFCDPHTCVCAANWHTRNECKQMTIN